MTTNRTAPAVRHRRTGWLLVVVAAVGLGATQAGCGGSSVDAPPTDDGYTDRQRAYLEYADAAGGSGGFHTQMARLVLGRPVDEDPIRGTIANVLDQPDVADFGAMDLARMLYLSDRHAGLSPEVIAEAEQAAFGFRYWFDERTEGTTNLTENHQVTYMAAEYLMGQRFPETVFGESALTGAERVARVRPRLQRWLDDRMRFGYSEWLSETYYGIDIRPLVSLVDFAEDEDIRNRAAIAMDLLVYDLALNSYQGWLGSTKGRSNGTAKFTSTGIVQTPIAILFGLGEYRGADESAGTAVATSSYRPPRVLAGIARDSSSFVTRQRNGIDVPEGPLYGIGYESDADAVFWYGMGAWSHPLVLPVFARLAVDYGVVPAATDTEALLPILEVVSGLPPDLVSFAGSLALPISAGSTYGRANIITYRSERGTLSSVQDQRKGEVGFAQHAWQATLGQRAVVFTTHPGPLAEGGSFGGNQWLGGSSMPRVGQHEDVAIVIYDAAVATLYGGLLAEAFLDYTHAYFPRDEFDEVLDAGQWTFGRKGEGYVALFSANPPTWTTEGEFAHRELVADGFRNVWICELGNADEDGRFADFTSAVLNAPLVVDGTEVRYTSPGRGAITFGWDAPLVVDGVAQDLGPHRRYDNPFSTVEWGASRAAIEHGGSSLVLDFETGARTGS